MRGAPVKGFAMDDLRFPKVLCLLSLGACVALPCRAEPVSDGGPCSSADGLSVGRFRDALKPVGFVLQEPGWHVWCNAPVLADDGSIHLFVSRWPVKAGFEPGWYTACEIAHYRAERAEGPYRYVETVLKGDGRAGSWRKAAPHNVTVVRLPDKRYAMLFIANNGAPMKPGDPKSFPATQKIGMFLASSLDGPWLPAGRDGLILDTPADPAIWSHGSRVGVNNPTLLPMPDGKFHLYYKALSDRFGAVRRMGLAIADRVEGPYRFEPAPLTANEGTIEDGFAFRLRDEVCLLVTDCHGAGFGGGYIYRSRDGRTFDPKPVRAFEPLDRYVTTWAGPKHHYFKWVLQRPALLLDRAGHPTHLFAPSGTAPEGGDGTASFLFRIEHP